MSRLVRNPAFGGANVGGGAIVSDSIRSQLAAARRSGSLRLGNKSLKEVPPTMRGFAEETYGNEKWWELVELQHIDFSHNAFASLPPFVMEWVNVQSLLLTGNQLKELPEESVRWTALKSLFLNQNQLVRLPKFAHEWSSLVELQCVDNALEHLPPSLCTLANLEVLNLTKNRLAALPADIGLLPLVRLQLGSNNLTALPASFGRLERLTLLELNENALVDVPVSALRPLTALTYLDLRRNSLTKLPALPAHGVLDTLLLSENALTHLEGGGLAACAQLTVLDLRQNLLARLNAADLAALPLKTLDLSNNELADLPHELGFIVSLTRIALEGNPLRKIRRGLLEQGAEVLKKYLRSRAADEQETEVAVAALAGGGGGGGTSGGGGSGGASSSAYLLPHEVAIRDAIRQCEYAHQQSKGTLSLQRRELGRLPQQLLPPAVFSTKWHVIDVDENALEHLSPNQFHSQAASLHKLSAAGNLLTRLPDSLFSCGRLQSLSLARNRLTCDALDVRAFGALHELKTLDLSFNALGLFPEAVFWLPSLTELVMQQTRLTGTMPDIGRMLARNSLVSLQLAGNKLDAMEEPDLRAMPSLTYLNVENNDFTKLPLELGLSIHLKAFLVNGNPLRIPPQSVISKGTPALLTHLRDRLSPERFDELEEFGPMLPPLPDPLPAALVPDEADPMSAQPVTVNGQLAPPSAVHQIQRNGPAAARGGPNRAQSATATAVSAMLASSSVPSSVHPSREEFDYQHQPRDPHQLNDYGEPVGQSAAGFQRGNNTGRSIPKSAAHFSGSHAAAPLQQHSSSSSSSALQRRALTADQEAAALYARESADAAAQWGGQQPRASVIATRQARIQQQQQQPMSSSAFAPNQSVQYGGDDRMQQQQLAPAPASRPIARPSSASRYGRGTVPPSKAEFAFDVEANASASASASTQRHGYGHGLEHDPAMPFQQPHQQQQYQQQQQQQPSGHEAAALDARIFDIERQLQSLSLPATRQFQLKKDLALAKAARNRVNNM